MSAERAYRHFDTKGRFWTPAWDYKNDQERTVQAVQLPSGEWREFERMVSIAEADAFAAGDRT